MEIALAEDTSDRMLAALLRGELDVAVVGLSGEPPAGSAHGWWSTSRWWRWSGPATPSYASPWTARSRWRRCAGGR
ncbi:hypothetical protein [Streptomyces antarcticus]|uniref:hypothetical protein n=1 Tax=Streptomyces antarcticus TaxID=2996458 RepID=UPI002D1E3FAD|nr:hypothetical protein [Streptomyces sp. H34-AA3]